MPAITYVQVSPTFNLVSGLSSYLFITILCCGPVILLYSHDFFVPHCVENGGRSSNRNHHEFSRKWLSLSSLHHSCQVSRPFHSPASPSSPKFGNHLIVLLPELALLRHFSISSITFFPLRSVKALIETFYKTNILLSSRVHLPKINWPAMARESLCMSSSK